MNRKELIYDALLRYQVDFSMQQEISLLRHSNWSSVRKVLDYGCGNGYYLSRLKNQFPDKEYWACDKNQLLLDCSSKYMNANTVCGEYPTVDVPADFDLVIARYLTSYLPNRKDFFSWVKEHSSRSGYLFLVDAYDKDLVVEPYLPLFMKGQEQFETSVRENGGNRDIQDVCHSELADLGYSLIESKTMVVNNLSPFVKEKLFSYMCLIASMDCELAMSSEHINELIDWLIDPNSFVQYGTFVSLYQLQGG